MRNKATKQKGTLYDLSFTLDREKKTNIWAFES